MARWKTALVVSLILITPIVAALSFFETQAEDKIETISEMMRLAALKAGKITPVWAEIERTAEQYTVKDTIFRGGLNG